MSFTIRLPGAESPSETTASDESPGYTIRLPAEQERSTSDQLERGTGLGVRALAQSAMALPNMALNAGIGIANLINRGTNALGLTDAATFPYASALTDRALTQLGLPEPENAGERVASDVLAGATGAGGLARFAQQQAARTAPSVEQRVLEALSKGPASQTVAGATGSLASSVTREAGGGDVAQLLAGIVGAAAPGVAHATGSAAIRGAVRGGEAGRQRYADRLQAFQDAGTTPSVGQASGNRVTQQVESGLANVSSSAGVIDRTAEREAREMGARIESIANDYLPGANSTKAGITVERGLTRFVDRFKDEQSFLYNKLDRFIPAETRIDVNNTLDRLKDLNANIPGAPALSEFFKNAKIGAIERAALADTATPADIAAQLQAARDDLARTVASRNEAASLGGRFRGYGNDMVQGAEAAYPVAGMPRIPSRIAPQLDRAAEAGAASDEAFGIARSRASSIRDAEARVSQLEDALDASQGRLPYEAVKKLRTLVGERITNNSLTDEVPRDKWKALYAALSEDMGAAAQQAGPDAAAAFKRANWFTRAGYDRIESVLDRVSGKDTAERIFQAAVNPSELREGATTIRAVMKSLDPEERRAVTAATVRRMGIAAPGAQNETGEVFSSGTFLSNYNKISPEAKATLFADPELRANLEQIAKASAYIRQGSRVFANPSGTSPAINNQVTGLSLIGSALTGHFGVTAGIATLLTAANASARLMTNPQFVRWLAKTTSMPEALLPTQVSMIANYAAKHWPEADRADLDDYLAQVKRGYLSARVAQR